MNQNSPKSQNENQPRTHCRVKLIIGLGNPGKEYAKTYHNAGFLFIDYLLKKAVKNEKLKSVKSFEYVKSGNIVFAKPLVFMNLSGKAVSDALKYFKLKPEEALIVHDDADISLGAYKLSFDSSSAGHRGIDSIIKTIKTQKFWRLRIGVGKNQPARKTPPSKESLPRRLPAGRQRKRLKAGEYVLQNISKKDLELINESFDLFIEDLLK